MQAFRAAQRASSVVVSALIVLLLGLGAAIPVLVLMERLESDRSDLEVSGTNGTIYAAIEAESVHLQVFVAQERSRIAAGEDIPIPDTALATADMHLQTITALIGFIDLTAPAEAMELRIATGGLRAFFLAYVNHRSIETLDEFEARTLGLHDLAAALNEPATVALYESFLALSEGISLARWIVIIASLVGIPALLTVVLFSGVRWQRLLAVANRREEALTVGNAALERRNQQFHGLYQVVTEVAETLSMKYVVQTTVRESRRLLDADASAVMILEDGVLRTIGVEGEINGAPAGAPEQLELGQGVIGRAAKRGKVAHVTGTELDPAYSGEILPGAKSLLVVPLIVGARVVGALVAWSSVPSRFTEDDLQVAELMASQVATAIAAAGMQEESEQQAHHDVLTGLPNRRQLQQDTAYEFEAATRRGRKLAVAMVDIDHFKDFNDQYGHHTGDVALQRVATTLAANLRREDRVYRYGGEEFAVVFDGMEGNAAAEAAERLRKLVEADSAVPDASAVTISIGVAAAPEVTTEFFELVEAADQALYRAKDMGRNRVELAETQPVSLDAAA